MALPKDDAVILNDGYRKLRERVITLIHEAKEICKDAPWTAVRIVRFADHKDE
jgi:tRNA nucleotidyltransferase/poly(A) polymerase